MFTRLFSAIRRMTEAAEGLAAALEDAASRFRTNVLDCPAEVPALPEPAAAIEEQQGKRRKAS